LAANGLRPFRPADAFYEVYAEDLAPELERLKPDLVVPGWGLPGAAIAARSAGIPVIWHGFGRMFPDGIGLELPAKSVPGLAHFDICPPSLQDKDFLASEDRIVVRPVPYSAPAEWEDRSRPLIYLTLGTAFGTAGLLATAIKGLSTLEAHLVVAAGRVPLDQFADVPGNVTVKSWVPQADLLRYADVVVHHGGSGTTLGALAVGAPQLILPQGADQFANADALCTSGAALRLLPNDLTADAIAEQTRKLLPHHGNAYRDAARTIAEEIAGMPAPDEIARHLPDYVRN
jgi:UDP:flavonoid glycosyltransferase YjiC (YdhE family)